jgi:hypothetical protein
MGSVRPTGSAGNVKHKKQHFVPKSYLEAWCDPATPPGHEPFVWVFPKDGGVPRQRAPKTIFRETDLYTIKLPGGHRDLRLEHGLAELESRFSSIARTVLPDHQEMALTTKVILCAFVAAMHSRTTRQRDHLQTVWGDILKKMEAMEADMRTRSPAEQKAIAKGSLPPRDPRQSLGIEEVRQLAAAPLQHTLISAITSEVPMLAEMHLAVLEAAPPNFFITSDAPCVWFDPEARERAFPYNQPGLGWPTIEVSLPVSPQQVLLFNRAGLDGYYRAAPPVIHELNRRTRGYAHKSFVSSHDQADPYWYQVSPDPPKS